MQSFSGSEFHAVLELLAYVVAARVYWRLARAEPVKPSRVDRFLLLSSALFGAALGSKGLHILAHLPALLSTSDWQLWLGGKSALGGFLGGTVGMELAKKAVGWRLGASDSWLPALAVGLVIGRLGCQFSGTWDGTYGVPTGLPWAWNYGDGIGRHPTALYEIALVIALALCVWRQPRLRLAPGARIAAFLLGYCVIRFALEWLKPPFGAAAASSLPTALFAGLTAIQWAAIIGAVSYAALLKQCFTSSDNSAATHG